MARLLLEAPVSHTDFIERWVSSCMLSRASIQSRFHVGS